MKGFTMMKSILWIGAGALAAYLVWWILPGYLTEKEDPRSAAYLGKIAAEINRSVPVMIDKETELLPTEGHQGMLIYNYRLVGYSVSQVNPQKFAAGAKQKITQGACNQPETRDDFLKKGVTLRYAYYDKDKRPIATIDVTPTDCGF
jgi:hypothetical protein